MSSAIMCTESNKQLLVDTGLGADVLSEGTKNDLVIVVQARDEQTAEQALQRAEEYLGSEQIAGFKADRSLDEALTKIQGANLAIISVPGSVAASVARDALEKNLHVHLFSDNVSLEDEIDLKKTAVKSGLLMMGPGCGTAIINGVPLGFANVLRRGSVGLVSAAGTGLQEVSCLIHQQGEGISQAIGVGGRDLSVNVGGIMMLEAIEALAKDPSTKVITLISKPPHPDVREKVMAAAGKCGKPVVVNLIGGEAEKSEGVEIVATLQEAAMLSVALSRGSTSVGFEKHDSEALMRIPEQERSKLKESQRYIRGLYTGGTLCYEALCILGEGLGRTVHANIDFGTTKRLEDSNRSVDDTCVDLGEEEFTQGMLHPMIDPSIRHLRMLKEGRDPKVAVLLLDVVLGYGSHPDPAGALIPVVREFRDEVEADGRSIPIVASVVGTDRDPQNRKYSVARLRDAGVIVTDSNAEAVTLSMLITKDL